MSTGLARGLEAFCSPNRKASVLAALIIHARSMVVVAFRRGAQGEEILRITVSYGAPVETTGDAGWLNFDFRPYSPRFRRTVGWHEDSEDWARSLPAAYTGRDVYAVVVEDSDPLWEPPVASADPRSLRTLDHREESAVLRAAGLRRRHDAPRTSAKRMSIILVAGCLAIGWVSGTFDHALAGAGLNFKPCAQNFFGATMCGEQLKAFCSENYDARNNGKACDEVLGRKP